MEFFIGVCVLLIVLYFAAQQIKLYNEIMLDKYRFRYFSLRDRLALMVINGDLEEDSWEYKKIVDTLNYHIKSVETMSIDHIVSMIAKYHTSPEEQRTVRIIEKRVKNEAILQLMVEFFSVTRQVLWRNSRTQIRALKYVVGKSQRRQRRVATVPEIGVMRNSKAALKRIDGSLESLSSSLSDVHAAAA